MRRLPAVVIIVVLVFPLLLAALSLVAVGTFVFDRGFYRGLISDQRLYDLPDAVSGASWQLSIPGLQPLTSRASPPAVRDVVTPDWLRSQGVRVLGQVFDFIDGRGPLAVSLDLVAVKRALAGEEGRTFAQDYAQGLAICAAPTPVRPGSLPTCRPRDQSVADTARLVRSSLPGILSAVPDVVPLGEEVPLPWPGFSVPRLYFAAVALLAMAGLGAWIGAAFTGSSQSRGRLLWLGGSLLAPGFLVVVVGLAALLPASTSWVEYGLSTASLQGVGYPPDFVAAVIAAARTAMMRVATAFLATGGIAAGVALGLLAWGWSTPQRREPGQTASRGTEASPGDAAPSTPG